MVTFEIHPSLDISPSGWSVPDLLLMYRVAFGMPPLFALSLACARVVVAKLNFHHWRKLRDAYILGIGTGDCTKVS